MTKSTSTSSQLQNQQYPWSRNPIISPVLDFIALAYLFGSSKHFWLASQPLIAASRLSPELQAILSAKLLGKNVCAYGGNLLILFRQTCSSGSDKK
jgi:hypothetical protein